MATYEITAPDGKTYHIEGPEGATDEEVKAQVLAQYPEAAGGNAAPDVMTEYQRRMTQGQSGTEIISWLKSQNVTPETLKGAAEQIRYRTQHPGKPISEYPIATEDQPGFWDTLGKATVSDAAGVAQGVASAIEFPYEVAKGLKYGSDLAIGEGAGLILDAFGQGEKADAARRIQQDKANALYSIPSAADQIEQMSPTPEGMGAARFTSQLLGGSIIPMGPKPVPRIKAPSPGTAARPARKIAEEVVEAGKREGVRVMTSDVRPPKGFTGRIARAVGERIPYLGTGGLRAAQQQERIEAVKNLARDFGADAGGNFLDKVAEDFARTRGKVLTGLTRAKDAIIKGIEGAVPTPRAIQAINQQVERLKGINADKFAPVIRELESFRTNLQSGKSLEQIEGNRRLLGDLFQDTSLAAIKGDGQKAINAIYKPLRDDMGDFIEQAAGTGTRARWKKANDKLAAMMGELDDAKFKRALASSDITPENVASLLFSKKPSEVRRLYSNLSPEGQAKARAGIIHMAIERAGGLDMVSLDKFASAIHDISETAGVLFEGADLQRLQGLERLLKYTKRAGDAAVAPPTGVQNSQFIGGYVTHSVLGPLSLPALGVYGGLARLYESPMTRNILIGLSKSEPGSAAESQWVERLMKAMSTQAGKMGEAANDIAANSPGRAAAQDEQDPR